MLPRHSVGPCLQVMESSAAMLASERNRSENMEESMESGRVGTCLEETGNRENILADEREPEINLFGNVFHGGHNELAEAVSGIGAFGHDVSL